jgi:putative ABC transport system permease protein
VRTRGNPVESIESVRTSIAALEPRLASTRISLGDDFRRDLLTSARIGAESFVAFGGLALLLASLGTYGVTSFAVGQRRREIAIRMAVGGSRATILREILSSSLVTIVAAALVGLLMAIPASQAMGALLYGVGRFDVTAFISSVAVLLGTAVVACAIPAWKAIQADLSSALRSD